MSLPAQNPAETPKRVESTARWGSEPFPPPPASNLPIQTGPDPGRSQRRQHLVLLDPASYSSLAASPKPSNAAVFGIMKRSLPSKVSPRSQQPNLRRSVSWHPNVVDHKTQPPSFDMPTDRRSRRQPHQSVTSSLAAPGQPEIKYRRYPPFKSADAFALTRPVRSPVHDLIDPSPPHSPPVSSTTSVSTPADAPSTPYHTKRVQKLDRRATTHKPKSKRQQAVSHGNRPTGQLARRPRVDPPVLILHLDPATQQQPPHVRSSRHAPPSTASSAPPPTAPPHSRPVATSSAIPAPKTRHRHSHQRKPDSQPKPPSRNLAILWQVDHIDETTSPYAWPLELFSPHKYSRNAAMAPASAAVGTTDLQIDSGLGGDLGEMRKWDVACCMPTSPVVRCGSLLSAVVGGGSAGGKKKKDAK